MLVTDPDALGAFCEGAGSELFRMETLGDYDVDSDGLDYQAYLNGEPGPDLEKQAAWHQVLQADLDRMGRLTRRVHVIQPPPGPYVRYECEWGYAQNLAYEDIRIVDLGDSPHAASMLGAGDFWLADRARVAVMRYDEDGRYLGFELAPDSQVPLYVAIADAAWIIGEPFETWWDRNRRYWRQNRHAA